jgi:hypothetical protein
MLGGTEDPLCVWKDCGAEAEWESYFESLEESEEANGLVATQTYRPCCDQHALLFCLEHQIEPPASLVSSNWL